MEQKVPHSSNFFVSLCLSLLLGSVQHNKDHTSAAAGAATPAKLEKQKRHHPSTFRDSVYKSKNNSNSSNSISNR
jgi:hypothetical protein